MFRAMPKTLGLAAGLVSAGVLLVLASLRGDWLETGLETQLPRYCVGLLFIGFLAWWEATRPRTGVLPSWTSPPTLIAGWTLAWIYLPALTTFFDDNLIDEITQTKGGSGVILTGLPLTCLALATLSLSYHVTSLGLARRVGTPTRDERPVALRRVIGLYLMSLVARGFHLSTLGVAYGTDITGWGSLQPVAQWIGYVEDLRFLALALLVVHAIRRRSGHAWLAILLTVELVLAVSSGFLTPVILSVVLCVVTAAAFNRLRSSHLVLIAAATLVVSTFVPVIAAIRQDRTGAIGTSDLLRVGDALAAPGKYWLAGVSAGEGPYEKFFGRQAEVAGAPGLVLMLTPAVVPFEGLDSFLSLPAALIPRALWPDKPTLSRGVWFSSTFRGLQQDTTSYSAMTIFSEGYLFYGWTGTVLAMVIVGGVLAVVRRRLDIPRTVAVYLALVPTILQIEPEVSSYLTMLVQRSVVFLIVFALLTHTKGLSMRQQRMRA